MVAGRLLLILTSLILLFVPPVAQAQPVAATQWALNRCGGGDSVQYTLALAGAITPDTLTPGGIETPSFTEAFTLLRPFLLAADLGIATLAGPLAGGLSPALAASLAENNLRLLGAAHPRVLDRGPAGVDATLQTLSRYGIFQHGLAPSGQPLPPFLKVTVPHPDSPLTLAFLSATWGLDGNADRNGQVNLLADAAGILPSINKAIEQARRETELVVVMAAWGNPIDPDPTKARMNAARNLIAAGADLVIGSIPGVTSTVDWVRVGERAGLVIFSAGDLVGTADMPAGLIYVGITRDADGAASITGFRYLPVNPGNGSRGPTPLSPAPAELSRLFGDPGQLHVIAPLPPSGKIEVCPPLVLPEMPTVPITGDFARFYQTFGEERPHSLLEAIALLGLPLGPVRRELSGDCQREVPVLYTERQRLELHTDNDWPNRVQGSHLGVVSFRLAYPDQPFTLRTDLSDPSVFAHQRFRTFYERYGGLRVFGYPISAGLTERDPATGRDLIVQYFERARFEIDPAVPPPADPLWQIRLGLLGREVGEQAIRNLCPAVITDVTNVTTETPVAVSTRMSESAQSVSDGATWMWWAIIGLVIVFVGVAIAAIYDLYHFAEQYQPLGLHAYSRSGYRRTTDTTTTVDAAIRRHAKWQDYMLNFARRRQSSPVSNAETETTPPSSSKASDSLWGWVLKRSADVGRVARNGPIWRSPLRTNRSAAPSAGSPSSVAETPPPTHLRSASESRAGQPITPSPVAADPQYYNEAVAAWFDEPTTPPLRDEDAIERNNLVGDRPIDWNDLPPAERERWMQEIGPLDDESLSDLPPAERERWQAELAAPQPEFDPNWYRATKPPAADERATRRLDDGESLPEQETSQRGRDDDDLLRKLLGI